MKNQKSRKYIENVCLRQLGGLPPHKILLALGTDMLEGAYKSLENYGILLDDLSFRVFCDIVTELLSEDGIEYEYTETQYNKLMEIKQLHKHF